MKTRKKNVLVSIIPVAKKNRAPGYMGPVKDIDRYRCSFCGMTMWKVTKRPKQKKGKQK